MPFMVNVPAIVPLPPRTAPAATLTRLSAASDPFTSKVPVFTAVGPVYVLAPARVHVPEPILVTEPAPLIDPP